MKVYIKEVVLDLEGKQREVRHFVEVEKGGEWQRRPISRQAFHLANTVNGCGYDLCVLITVPDQDGGTKEQEIYWRKVAGADGDGDNADVG